MIDFGWGKEVEVPPFVCGAYMSVGATAEDAFDIQEIREQAIARLMGWA